jgi:hypothetical protein
MQYTSVGSTWNWLNYFAIDSDTRYLKNSGGQLTGNLTLNAQSDVRFADSDSSNWVAFQGPATISSNVTWTLPSTDGTANQVLSTNGSGTLSWATAAAGGASVTTSDTAPSTPADGDLWYDSVGGRLYVYYQDPNTSQWVDAAPQGGGSSTPTKIEVGNTKAEVTDTGSNGTFAVTTEGTQRLTVDSSGRTLIGTSTARDKFFASTIAPAFQLEGSTTAAAAISTCRNSNDDNQSYVILGKSRSSSYGVVSSGDSIGEISFQAADGTNFLQAARITAAVDGTPGTNDMPGRIVLSTTPDGSASPVERLRVDSSGRLLVGTSTAIGNFAFAASNSSNIDLTIANKASYTFGTNQESRLVLGKEEAGYVSPMGIISARPNDPTTSADGLMTFSTRNGQSMSERMRIGSSGTVIIGPSTANFNSEGVVFSSQSAGQAFFVRNNDYVAWFNRLSSDGEIIQIAQDSVKEGSISVSGTTVSYNGAHLSRWSQLPGGAERTEILRGTVLSNIDEMCGWGDEENEQLNRMKVSDVEGDPNVSGVFQAWDDDDDTYTDDFYCAMTGDMIIRIAEGVTVQRGDLLMSAGDGTAKPQDDDIIRSKTIAKVTSTHVTCTYDDGSYCVPCVLMAC